MRVPYIVGLGLCGLAGYLAAGCTPFLPAIVAVLLGEAGMWLLMIGGKYGRV